MTCNTQSDTCMVAATYNGTCTTADKKPGRCSAGDCLVSLVLSAEVLSP